ncbi:hypothetical protein EVAR_75124_1 [Eumeta japonica]|uniref:Uncharacterized protein n=1 Tax=Eumeta variegata TaxID=151549 RepID=A0A4C1U0F1_EUMVA|nr:hypothetical protein EVAR_75124_1 [Eumeta japonica]
MYNEFTRRIYLLSVWATYSGVGLEFRIYLRTKIKCAGAQRTGVRRGRGSRRPAGRGAVCAPRRAPPRPSRRVRVRGRGAYVNTRLALSISKRPAHRTPSSAPPCTAAATPPPEPMQSAARGPPRRRRTRTHTHTPLL